MVAGGGGATGERSPELADEVGFDLAGEPLELLVDVDDALGRAQLGDGDGDRDMVEEGFELLALQRAGEVRRLEQGFAALGGCRTGGHTAPEGAGLLIEK